jgi:hypothetical protein
MMVFFGVITVFSQMYGDIQQNYEINIESNVSHFYDTINEYRQEMYIHSLEIANSTEGSEVVTYPQASGVELMTSAIWNVIKIPFQVIDIIYSMLADLAELLYIPSWIITIILSILLTMIVFIIIKAVFRIEL